METIFNIKSLHLIEYGLSRIKFRYQDFIIYNLTKEDFDYQNKILKQLLNSKINVRHIIENKIGKYGVYAKYNWIIGEHPSFTQAIDIWRQTKYIQGDGIQLYAIIKQIDNSRLEDYQNEVVKNWPKDANFLIHGDFHTKNIIVNDKIILIDWEFACIAHPKYDLAYLLIYEGILMNNIDKSEYLSLIKKNGVDDIWIKAACINLYSWFENDDIKLHQDKFKVLIELLDGSYILNSK